MRPLLYDHQVIEALRLNHSLAPHSEDIVDWLVEQGADSTGAPAIWVWVIIRDEGYDRVWHTKEFRKIERHVEGCLFELLDVHFDFELYIYVRFRLQSEQEQRLQRYAQ